MGKLHHHLGLPLSREVEGEELRGVYHLVKRYFWTDLFDHNFYILSSLQCIYISKFGVGDDAPAVKCMLSH